MNRLACLSLAATLAVGTVSMTACTPGNNIPGATATGAVAGGLLGAALFHGSGAWVGVATGALLGGVLGNQIGQNMDQQDDVNMRKAVETLPVGHRARWTNDHHVTYVVTPVREYHVGHRRGRHHHRRREFCREYRVKVKVGEHWRNAYGTACRKPDGSWRIKN